MILKNGKIYYNGRLNQGAILIQDGIIKSIYKESNNHSFKKFKENNHDGIEIDCEDRYILPGMIDIHSHLRDMGQCDKETFYSGTKAAAYSGLTTVFNMPNTIPPAINAVQVNKWQQKAKNNIFTDVGFISGVPNSIDEEEIKNILALGIIGFKIYPLKSLNGIDWTNSDNIQKILQISSRYQIPIFIHPDWPISSDEIEVLKKKYANYSFLKLHNKLHSETYEAKYVNFILENYSITERDLNSSSIKPPILHFCHISCKESFNLIQKFIQAKKDSSKVNISFEVTPHHLLLSNDIILRNENIGKVLPPLRDKPHSAFLFKQLKEGNIHLIGTDHAPHSINEKLLNNFEAPSGFPGFETYSYILLNKVFQKKLSLERFVEVSSENPAKRFNLSQKGFIAEGKDADLVIIEKVPNYTISSEKFKTKAKFTPFENSNLSDRKTQILIW